MPIISLEQLKQIASRKEEKDGIFIDSNGRVKEMAKPSKEEQEEMIAKARESLNTYKTINDILNHKVDISDIFDLEDVEEAAPLSSIGETKTHDASRIVDHELFPRTLNSSININNGLCLLNGKVNANTTAKPQRYGNTRYNNGRRYVKWNDDDSDQWIDETIVRVSKRRAKATYENWKALADAISNEGGEDVALAWETMTRSPCDKYFRKEIFVMFEHRIYQHPLYKQFTPCFMVAINCDIAPKTKVEAYLSGPKKNELQRTHYAALMAIMSRIPAIGIEIANMVANNTMPEGEFERTVVQAVQDAACVSMKDITREYISRIKDTEELSRFCQEEYGLDYKVVGVVVGRSMIARARRLGLAGSHFYGHMKGIIMDTSRQYEIATGEGPYRDPRGFGPDC